VVSMLRVPDFIAFNLWFQEHSRGERKPAPFYMMWYPRRNCPQCANEMVGGDNEVYCDDCLSVCSDYDRILNYDEFDDRDDALYGNCPTCGYPLSNWGAASDGDGDLYDEIGCDACQEVVRKIHAETCECVDCLAYRGEYYATEAE
jgi:hypothetical protein